MVTRATVTSSKTVDFSFRGPFGFEAHTVLLSVESDSPEQYAFESVGGNIALMGIVDFSEIRPNCTEVTLAVHYEIKNKIFAWLDRGSKSHAGSGGLAWLFCCTHTPTLFGSRVFGRGGESGRGEG